jgi:hypothetical protein
LEDVVTPDEFKSLVESLTGRSVRPPVDDERLREALDDDDRELGFSQFNELLLMVNKNRIQRPFFELFFNGRTRVGQIPECVEEFRIAAMLRYGNFIHAYKTWTQLRSLDRLRAMFAELPHSRVPGSDLEDRMPPLVEIVPIPEKDTYLVGEMMSHAIVADLKIQGVLLQVFSDLSDDGSASWDDLTQEAMRFIDERHHPQLEGMIRRFRDSHENATPEKLREELQTRRLGLEELDRRCKRVIEVAQANLDTYLTWDHMDIYIATSMRHRGDFESVHKFAQAVQSSRHLAGLHLRFFDPTQSKAMNRVNKGLVEALMLKRAFCTIYSVQDSDTLGKDSELAATLAQGKPVIAYVPELTAADISSRVETLLDSDVSVPYEGYNYLCHSVPTFHTACEEAHRPTVDALRSAQAHRFWESEPVGKTLRILGEEHKLDVESFAQAWAESEKALLDKRAKVLREYHPLAFQVNLSSGVANGLLVARSIDQCAKLVRDIAKREMTFYIDNDPDEGVCFLREETTASPFRVVTQAEKLTNSFWSFYVAREEHDHGCP